MQAQVIFGCALDCCIFCDSPMRFAESGAIRNHFRLQGEACGVIPGRPGFAWPLDLFRSTSGLFTLRCPSGLNWFPPGRRRRRTSQQPGDPPQG